MLQKPILQEFKQLHNYEYYKINNYYNIVRINDGRV